MSQKLFLLPGDGIGVEVMSEVKKLVAWLNQQQLADFDIDTGLVGGSAYDKYSVAISEEDMQKALAVLSRSYVELKILPTEPDMTKFYTEEFLPN